MEKVNIIIPSIEIDGRLIRCLKGIEKQTNKNFFVTLVLDKRNNLKILKKFKFQKKILILPKQTMSKKRNYAALNFNSKYLAFIDSDAYPCKNWLLKSIKLLKKKKHMLLEDQTYPLVTKNIGKR